MDLPASITIDFIIGFVCFFIGALWEGAIRYREGKEIGYLQGQRDLLKQINDKKGLLDA